MITWEAREGSGAVTVEAWCGDHGTADLRLFDRNTGNELGRNPSVAKKLSVAIAEPDNHWLALQLGILAARPDGGTTRIFHSVSQNGEILPARDNSGAIVNGDANGNPPYAALELPPPAPDSQQTHRDFDVGFV